MLILGFHHSTHTSRGWRNREPDDNAVLSLKLQYERADGIFMKPSESTVLYTLHLASFTQGLSGVEWVVRIMCRSGNVLLGNEGAGVLEGVGSECGSTGWIGAVHLRWHEHRRALLV